MMNSPLPEQGRQGIDYGEKANVQNLHAGFARNQGDSRVTIQPFSLRTLIICGLTFFFAAFIWSRYGIDTTTPGNAPSAPVSQTPQANASSASTAPSAAPEAGAPAVVHVVMKNMKFNPATVEVKSGGVVEWKNEDITQHTATAPSFDSAAIDPDKSWKHTFGEPGNFPYNCTFHPDMKAVVIVK
jgi:plastocyanin